MATIQLRRLNHVHIPQVALVFQLLTFSLPLHFAYYLPLPPPPPRRRVHCSKGQMVGEGQWHVPMLRPVGEVVAQASVSVV